ncbi:AAA family ATPase [Clostridium weizhouense]|uniref:AAA family ATPase n=1 Tax=Clostridium weizhouense TaxID=2859781 RepID=A0ABS7AN90_9CLOT|nr:AAA family ATPase [Clostridium weizhouense]MBW6410138.1 AAA family ATPase [Clostridium weizhouense]
MKFSGNDIVKFIFPELQIIEVIKEHGFIVRPSENKRQKQTQNMRQKYSKESSYSRDDHISTNNLIKQTFSNRANAEQNVNTAAYQHKDTSKVNSNNISDIFNSIRSEIGNLIIGQTDYLDNLCIAFKRPFVTGYDKFKPKNVIFILGNKGTGKHSSISFISGLLKQRKIISSDVVSTIDLSLYATVSEFQIFLSDLYKALYGQSDIVIFNNFDKCHSSIIDIIETLTNYGKYTLSSRYVFQNNNLVEANGMLLQDSISEISANNKYFVFPSEKSEKDVMNTFGAKFMECVGDILHTENFSCDELNKIAEKLIGKNKRKCSENLSIVLQCDNTVSQVIVSNYRSVSGINGLEKYIDSNIYKPLAELKLKIIIKNNQNVFLSVIDGKFSAQIDDDLIRLTDVLPQKNMSGLDDVRKEVKEVIGLESVKQYVLSLEDNLKIQKIRENAGFKAANISMHMIFTGNPGTGKTTIARIVAKYLKALGVLSQGQLREVTRADLVGQYVGHTAKLTNDAIKSALGGVLFIDEAYALCRDKHDAFGLEAIDTLVKGIEDNRDDLVVILAGYKDEMGEFLKTNSGLKSRFPNLIDFEDYTSEEMYEISLITAKSKGYKVSEDCKDPLIKLFDKKQIKGRNDSGNGRLVRNVIESAILNQSKRLLVDETAAMDLLTYDDFKFEETGNFDLEASLSKIIGLENVKDFVRTQYKLLIAQEKRRKVGMMIDASQALNMIFSGNPGTGKTTIARIVAEMFKEMGLLKSGHLIETDRSGLVAEYVGQTAKKTEEVFRSALGGILFIDEAYALANDGGSFGKEAIDTLVKLIEDSRGEIIVILAGYKKEMSDFLKSNSGLESRFPLMIDFPDYSADDLFEISLKMIKDKGFVLDDRANILMKEQISQLHKQSNAHSGNGRMVRNYIEEIMRKQSSRIAMNDVSVAEMNIIISDDIEVKNKSVDNFNLENQLSKIIGLEEVKDYIRGLSARLRMQNERKKLGLPVDSKQTLHMIFKGNPGTGKTMMARTVAEVLYNMGVIKTSKLVEIDRAGLVAGYVGQTAIKTREKIMEAMDGVLFIDEAYSLSQGGDNDFGKEAIDTLIKLMDDYRDRLVVILAGYSDDMDKFLFINAGLKSRFPNIIKFEDYSGEQLVEIAEMLFEDNGYEIHSSAKNKLKDIFDAVRLEPQFGNGRYVRNLYEKAVNNQAVRLSSDMDLTKEELITIVDTDIERV